MGKEKNVKMYDIITFGSGTVDIFMNTKDKLFQYKSKRCIQIPFGSKIAIQDTHVLTGGGGTNSFTWSNASTAATVTVATTANYYVEVEDQYTCVGKDTVAFRQEALGDQWTLGALQ